MFYPAYQGYLLSMKYIAAGALELNVETLLEF
jgi:hypothetical protein